MNVLWQATEKWHNEIVGHGPGRYGAVGCVWFSLVHAIRGLTIDATFDPVSNMTRARAEPGAFVDGSPHGSPGDEMVWPIAAPLFGLDVGPAVNGPAAAIQSTISEGIAGGYVALRVSTDGGTAGQHTILGHTGTGSSIVCACSALARDIEIDWASLSNPAIHWGATPRPYRVVAARALRALDGRAPMRSVRP